MEKKSMRRKPFDADDPRRWMAFARSDLKLAKEGCRPGIRLEGLCYLAQQAAEKAVKAVLMHAGVDFPRVHQIQTLLEYLPLDVVLPTSVRDASDLSDYAVEGRYPQNFEDVTKAEYRAALDKSRAVVAWAEKAIAQKHTPEVHEPKTAYRVPKRDKRIKSSRIKKN